MTPPYTPGGYGAALEALLLAKGVHAQHAGGDGTAIYNHNFIEHQNLSAVLS